VVVGGFYSVSLFFLVAPSFRGTKPARCVLLVTLLALAAGLLGLMVAVSLIRFHEEQFQMRLRLNSTTAS
jgi:hypothetical protein